MRIILCKNKRSVKYKDIFFYSQCHPDKKIIDAALNILDWVRNLLLIKTFHRRLLNL